MMLLIITTSTMFLFTAHPLSTGLLLLLQTIFISLTLGNLSMKFWYSYILFIIMIGGMLVLFMYMTSISSNKKFKFSRSMTMMLILMPMLLMTTNKMYPLQISLTSLNLTVSKFFNSYSSSMMILLMIYFFITLIAIVKTTKTNFGPLRQK